MLLEVLPLTTTTIRAVEREDIEPIQQLAVTNRMFGPDEVDFFVEAIEGHLDGSLPDDYWIVAWNDDRLVGAAYLAPEPFGALVWNLYFIATDPTRHGTGIGKMLMSGIEDHLVELGGSAARVLIVETSATDQYVGARRFYEALGFDRESTIRDYYGPGDAKVTYWKGINR